MKNYPTDRCTTPALPSFRRSCSARITESIERVGRAKIRKGGNFARLSTCFGDFDRIKNFVLTIYALRENEIILLSLSKIRFDCFNRPFRFSKRRMDNNELLFQLLTKLNFALTRGSRNISIKRGQKI